MKITQETDYALRIVDKLSDNPTKVTGSSVLSEDLGVPLRFALKILRKLNAAGITKANRGVNGGYYLNMDPKDITYKAVIEAIEGEIYINKCLCSPEYCNRQHAEKCDIHLNLSEVQEMLLKELESYNFAQEKK